MESKPLITEAWRKNAMFCYRSTGYEGSITDPMIRLWADYVNAGADFGTAAALSLQAIAGAIQNEK